MEIFGIVDYKVEKFIYVSENKLKVSTSIWVKESSGEPVNLNNKDIESNKDFFKEKNNAIKRLINIHENECVLLKYNLEKNS